MTVARKALASSGSKRNGLHVLARQVAALRKRAKTLGVFSHDRGLLECSDCGLMEDVTTEGALITCRAKTLGRDTGLRFSEVRGNRFSCPGCGLILGADCVPVAQEPGSAPISTITGRRSAS